MPYDDTYKREDNTYGQRKVQTADDIAAAQAKERLSSTAGSGLGSKGKSLTGAPKQEPGEDAKAFGEKMRKWREAQVQQKAFGGK